MPEASARRGHHEVSLSHTHTARFPSFIRCAGRRIKQFSSHNRFSALLLEATTDRKPVDDRLSLSLSLDSRRLDSSQQYAVSTFFLSAMNCLSRPTAIRLLSAQFSTRLVHCCSVQGAQRHASSSDHRPLPYSWRRSQYAEQRAAFGDGKVPRALRSRYELFYDRGEEVIDSDRAVWMQYDRHAPPSTMSNDGETTAGASVDESDFKGLDLSSMKISAWKNCFSSSYDALVINM